MKGLQGLILAVGLGIAGALLNWAYLMNRTSEKVNVYFVGVKPNVTLNVGDMVKAEHIERVGLPKDAVGNLSHVAVYYDSTINDDMQSVVGQKVSRMVVGARLLMNEDLKTPPPELRLEADEKAMFVPVDTRSIVTSLIVPGDQVVFLVLKTVPGKPTPATPTATPASLATGEPVPDPANGESPIPAPSGPFDPIGPFKILSIGNRLGSTEVMKSAHISPQQENVMTISIKAKDEAKALHLQSRLEATNYRQVGVWLLGRKESK